MRFLAYKTLHRIVTTVCRFLRLRTENRFHPLPGLGASDIATSAGDTSISTGTPGNDPFTVPDVALIPSIVTAAPPSNCPDHTITPEAGPLYRGAAGAAGAAAADGVGYVRSG